MTPLEELIDGAAVAHYPPKAMRWTPPPADWCTTCHARHDDQGASVSEISDETVTEYNRAHSAVWQERAPISQGEATTVAREATRAGLAAALVASGYRPEADVLREAAEKLRSAAAGRREYAESLRRDPAFEDVVGMLDLQADTIEAAARVAEGDLGPLYNWLPSRRWTDEMTAKLHGDRATALSTEEPA